MSPLERKLIELSYDLVDLPDSRFKHTTFIVKRNKIISYGWNSKKTSPQAKKYDYFMASRHSELHAIMNFPYDTALLRHYSLYNVRINNLGEVCLSKPCPTCQTLLSLFGVVRVKYTNETGVFVSL